MLPKSKRLNLKKDFKWVASGKKLETKYLKIYVKYGQSTQAKVGIAVSSKTFKKATARNKAKRLVSSAFESAYSQLPTNISIVAIPKPGILDVKSSDALLDLEEILKKEYERNID
ncbi:MAG: ribonuclease P protein component [Patescibacteria group bacterium]